MIVQPNRCRRCGGMMVKTYVILLSPSETCQPVTGWGCVNCGEYLDQQVLLNRSAQAGVPAVLFGLGRHTRGPQRPRPIRVHLQTVAA